MLCSYHVTSRNQNSKGGPPAGGCDPYTGICGGCPLGGSFCPIGVGGGGGGGGGGPISHPRPVTPRQMQLAQGFVGVDDALEFGFCAVQPEVCVAIGITVGAVAVIQLARVVFFGRVQTNEWVDLARRVAKGAECAWLKIQQGLPQNQDAATQKKIVQAQKYLGCRNVQKRN